MSSASPAGPVSHDPRVRGREEQGFTLIELLVVILIIGVLAAIALPVFLDQTDKGRDSSAKSAVRNAVSLVESCLTDTEIAADCASDAEVVRVIGSAGLGTATVTDRDDYVLTSESMSANTFTISKTACCGAPARPPAPRAPAAGAPPGECSAIRPIRARRVEASPVSDRWTACAIAGAEVRRANRP